MNEGEEVEIEGRRQRTEQAKVSGWAESSERVTEGEAGRNGPRRAGGKTETGAREGVAAGGLRSRRVTATKASGGMAKGGGDSTDETRTASERWLRVRRDREGAPRGALAA